MTDDRRLRVWMWEGVLCDYTCGMAVVVAHDEEEARKLLAEDTDDAPEYVTDQLPFAKAREITEPSFVYVYGGG